MSNEIELLSRAEQMLATVARADEAAKLADMAEAARVYARKADLGTAAVNHATIIKARALKRMAELVDAGQARGEIASRDMNLRRGPDVPRQDIGEPPATLSDLGITRQRLHEARKLEPLPDATMVEIAEEANDRGEEVSVSRLVKAAQSDRLSVHYSSESPEWYTPPEIVERVIRCLGAIDLDPCSNSGAPNIPASLHFTESDNGLLQEWQGRIYMNPPYGRPIARWVEKLCGEYRAGHVSAAVALVPARTDTTWFQMLRDAAMCFIDGRLKFSGHDNAAPFPSAAAYLGDNIAAFADAFGGAGDIWVRWHH